MTCRKFAITLATATTHSNPYLNCAPPKAGVGARHGHRAVNFFERWMRASRRIFSVRRRIHFHNAASGWQTGKNHPPRESQAPQANEAQKQAGF
jgi:hypothetical protein